MNTLVVIAGPTAVGKTAVAIRLAKAIGSDIISADSRQFYRELTIGTAKPNDDELREVKHHFINSHGIQERFTAYDFGFEVKKLLPDLFSKNSIQILCGGTGLYIDAALNGMDEIPTLDEAIRANLMEEYQKKGIEFLQEELKTMDPVHHAQVDLNNPHRLIRALEVTMNAGVPYSSLLLKKQNNRTFNVLKIGLELDRDVLYGRINERVDSMVKAGLEQEANSLLPCRNLNALQTVGYKEFFDYFDHNISYQTAVEKIKQHSRNYAKRQLTWFRRDNEMHWFNPMDIEKMLEFVHLKTGNL